jgi:hypothetical protein
MKMNRALLMIVMSILVVWFLSLMTKFNTASLLKDLDNPNFDLLPTEIQEEVKLEVRDLNHLNHISEISLDVSSVLAVVGLVILIVVNLVPKLK